MIKLWLRLRYFILIGNIILILLILSIFHGYPSFVDIICISWIYPYFVDIICIGHIASYLSSNVCPIFHI